MGVIDINKKHVFWVGSIGYQYDNKNDLLEEIKEHLENDVDGFDDYEIMKSWNRIYTKKQANEILFTMNHNCLAFNWVNSSRTGINVKALIMYYAKYGK